MPEIFSTPTRDEIIEALNDLGEKHPDWATILRMSLRLEDGALWEPAQLAKHFSRTPAQIRNIIRQALRRMRDLLKLNDVPSKTFLRQCSVDRGHRYTDDD